MTSFLALLGVFLIGFSKAGFAAGLGMLSTPLMAQASRKPVVLSGIPNSDWRS